MSSIQQSSSDTSVYGYYKPKYADEVERVITVLQQKPGSRFNMLCSTSRLGLNSLYLRWWQGSKYLADHKPLLASVLMSVTVFKIFNGPNKGLIIRYDPKQISRSFEVCEVAAKQEWRSTVEEFVEDAEVGAIKSIEKVALTGEDITFLNTIFNEHFVWSMSKTTLRIVRQS